MATPENTNTEAAKAIPRVDFYVTKAKEPAPEFALQTTCRIADKAFSAGHRIHICVDDTNDCEKLDALLWSFRDGSFIPHEVSDSPIQNCPVTISTTIGIEHTGMLLNVTHKVPENFMQFQRIAEIINNQPESVVAGRERYRFYRESGLDPQHHEVSST
ncbi:MAG: DNA polymerase III subunit chi [Gammaproteobacteria bacterium]